MKIYIEQLYVEHTKAAIDSLGADAEAATDDAEAEATDDTAADDAAETTEEAAE